MRNIRLAPVSAKDKIKKHFYNYLIELAQFDPTVSFDAHGEPIYKWYDLYWTEKARYPFMLCVDGQFAGLALVRETAPQCHEIAEFYVLPGFRRDDNAMYFAAQLAQLFGGEFTFATATKNVRAVRFWDKFACRFARGGSSVEGAYKKWWIVTETATPFDE